VLERDLVAWVAAGVVEFLAPGDERAESLDALVGGADREATGSGEAQKPGQSWRRAAGGASKQLEYVAPV
jgi:hypothetical protein